jgi:hypothetical protein
VRLSTKNPKQTLKNYIENNLKVMTPIKHCQKTNVWKREIDYESLFNFVLIDFPRKGRENFIFEKNIFVEITRVVTLVLRSRSLKERHNEMRLRLFFSNDDGAV